MRFYECHFSNGTQHHQYTLTLTLTALAKGIKYYDALKIMNEKRKAFLFFEVHEHGHEHEH